MNKIAFIGAGNMNTAIISGLINSGIDAKNIIVSNPSPEKREALAKQLGILHTANNIEAADFADTIVLGVKPHFIADVCQQISQAIDVSRKCFLSVAAGTTVATIQQALGGNVAVVRTMPNTPSQLGLGITGAYPSSEVNEDQKAFSETLIKAVGEIVWVENESDIDNITAVSGSGPAYFFLFMEAMENTAKDFGFTPEQSRLLVQQTALGAATMVAKNNISISQLRENVTSKGGTTQAALTSFVEGGLPELVEKSMHAAVARAKEMAKNA
ncbi:MAG: pyrroline-5-carboxylate reductase [Thalassotalea sp.]